MKLLVVFNEKQDIVFYHSKGKFLTNLLFICRSESCSQSDGSQNESGESTESEIVDLLVQHFAPLLTSQRVMKSQLGVSYESIALEDNVTMYLRQVRDFHLVGICGNDELPDGMQQLQTFEQIAYAICGPCLEQLKPNLLDHRECMWRFFKCVFEMWRNLYQRDFAFLFEAIENVLIPNSTLTNNSWRGRSIAALERAISKFKLNVEPISQIYIVCGTKRFCLYTPEGKGIEITANNYLTMCVLAKTLFPEPEYQLDRSCGVRYVENTTGQTFDRFQSCHEDDEVQELSGGIKFSTPPFCTPRDSTDEEDPSIKVDQLLSNLALDERELCDSLINIAASNAAKTEARLTKSDPGPAKPNIASKKLHEKSNHASPKLKTCTKFKKNYKDPCRAGDFNPIVLDVEIKDAGLSYKIVRMMLNTTENPFAPHRMHFIRLHQGVIFIGVEVITGASFSNNIHQALSLINLALSGQPKPTTWLEQLKQQCKALRDVGKLNLHAARAYTNIKSFLHKLIDQPFAYSVKQEEPDPGCEMALTGMQVNLRTCFTELFLSLTARVETTLCQNMALCAAYVRNKMTDFLDFLEVKARRNLAATSLQSRYPGIVHFFWVDRHTEHFICTSPDFEHMSAQLVMRMWRSLAWCKREVHRLRARKLASEPLAHRNTVTVVFRREKELQYSFHLIPEPLGAIHEASLPSEFCMVHLGCVPTVIINHHQALLMTKIRERTRSSVNSLIE